MAKNPTGDPVEPTQSEALILIDRDNLTALRLLAKALVGERPPVAFIGAGLTARSGFPTWEELIKALASHIGGWKKPSGPTQMTELEAQMNIEDLEFSAADLLWRANFCFDFFEMAEKTEEYFDTLKAQFKANAERNPVLDAVVRLPFSQFLTTNYDPSICNAYKEAHGKELKMMDWGLDAPEVPLPSGNSRNKRCVHLHGWHARPEGIILREDDYQKRYFEGDFHVVQLKTFLETNPVVFIGYSLADLDVMNVLRTLKARSSTNHSHFAIMPLSDEKPEKFIRAEERRLHDKFGIKPIFFRRLTNDFLGLEEAIRLLASYVERYRDRAPTPIARRPVVTASRRKQSKVKSFSFREGKLDKAEFPDDPNKGAFGGESERKGRRLSATVKPTKTKDSRWFRIELKVEALPGSPNLKDSGTFYAHPTFQEKTYEGKLAAGGRVIERKFWAYGAFTVGVLVDGGKTALELDLAELPGAPKAFRER